MLIAGIKQQQYVDAGEAHNQKHNKTLNPKFSELIDSIARKDIHQRKEKDFVN